ncbi:MAG: stage III sporulation protein AA [Clostridia bacterium]|nr:stage III sporulation protein AA [Clostridia bacterium]MDD4047782.1 stage III sporulation protein AA [Clostridia bacterium]
MAKVFINKDADIKESINKENVTTHPTEIKKSIISVSPLKIYSLSWFQALSPNIQELVIDCLQSFIGEFEEIRLRINQPIIFRTGLKEMTVTSQKQLTFNLEKGYLINKEEIDRTVQLLSQNSLYAWEDEFKNGYITIPGGHRVGFVGKCVLDKGNIKTIKDISGINYRIGRQVLGCADKIIPHIINNDQIYHTLIISPPQCGKTTLLRDIVRQISDGISKIGFQGVNVGLVDERSEIAGVYQGKPQFQIGLRTDILDACPKSQGMMMLIRSMSPRVIATDEIGKKEDIDSIYNALQAGVTVITTVHGGNYEEIKGRPNLKELINWRFFDRIIVLSRRKGVGTLETVIDGKTLEGI